MDSSVGHSIPRLSVLVIANEECVSVLSELTKTFLIGPVGLDEASEAFAHLQIAVMETVTNVVRHSYRGREPGPLSLEVTAADGWVSARLCNQGVRFDATRTAEIPDPLELAEGGYGLGVVQTLMDELHYSYGPDTGNQFTMRKRIQPSAVTGEQR